MKRRGFFGLFAAPVAIPLARVMPAEAASVPEQIKTGYELLHSNWEYTEYGVGPSLTDIISTTLRTRSAKLADNVTANNALLQSLKKRGTIMVASNNADRPNWDDEDEESFD